MTYDSPSGGAATSRTAGKAGNADDPSPDANASSTSSKGSPDADSRARDAIRHLLDGNDPDGIETADLTVYGTWSPIVSELVRAHGVGGRDAVRKTFDAMVRNDPALDALIAEQAKNFVTTADVHAVFRSVRWTWQNWLPRGQLSLIVGEPGIGKSYFLASLIGAFTGCRDFPDGSVPLCTGSVVICESESMRSAYVERLRLLGVDDDLVIWPAPKGDVHFVPSLPDDVPLLTSIAQANDISALVVDSLSGSHSLDENDASVRVVMTTLSKLAAVVDVPVIAVHHTRKRGAFEKAEVSLDRIRGSSVFAQFARSCIALSKPDPDQDVVRVESVKNSFGPRPEPFGVRLADDGVHFEEAPEAPREPKAREKAMEFLRVRLRKGPRKPAELEAEAAAEGISRATLHRAKKALRIVSGPSGWALRAKP